MTRRRKIHPEDPQPVEGEEWDQNHQGYSYHVRRYWGVLGEPRHDFYDYNHFSKPALIQICRDVGVAANTNETVRRLISKIRRQYNRKEVLAALRAELARRGLKPEGNDGLELRKRLDTYGNIGFAGLGEEAVREELDKRHVAYENGDSYCQLLLLLIRYEFETNKEYCHWPWNMVRISDMASDAAARVEANARTIREEEARLRTSPRLSSFRGHENVVFLQTDVVGDGSCLFRAFAHAYYGNENQWENVRDAARFVWAAAMGTNNSVARYRAQLYLELDEQSQDPRPSRRRARLEDQLFRDGHWGSVEMLQLLADAYGVEVFAHFPAVDLDTRAITWGLQVRGDHAEDVPQIHLVNYPNLGGGHWTAVAPDEEWKEDQYTAHLEFDTLHHLHRNPLTKSEELPVPLRRVYTGMLPEDVVANYDATPTPSPSQQGNPSMNPVQHWPVDPDPELNDVEIDMGSESGWSLSSQYSFSSLQFTPTPPSGASIDSSDDSAPTPPWNHTPSPESISSDALTSLGHSSSGTANSQHSNAHILQQPSAPPTTPATVIRPQLGSPFTTPPSRAPSTSRSRFSRIRQTLSNTPSPRSRRVHNPFPEHVTATGRTASLSVRSPPSKQSSPISAATVRRETRRNTAPRAPKFAGVRKAGRRDAKTWSGRSGRSGRGHGRKRSGGSSGSGSMSISSGSSRTTTASRGAGDQS